MADKLTRKYLKRPDVLLSRLREGYRWAEDNVQKIILFGGALFVVAAVGVFINQFVEGSRGEAAENFYTAEKMFEEKRLKLQETKKAKQGIPLLDALRPEINALSAIAEEYSGSEEAFMAHSKLGDLYAEQKSYPKAIGHYEKALKGQSSRFFEIVALYNLGYLYELSGQFEQGIEHFQKITRMNRKRVLFWSIGYRPNTFWLASAYFGIARCYQGLKRDSEARETYIQVADQFPDSVFGDKAKALALLVGSNTQ